MIAIGIFEILILLVLGLGCMGTVGIAIVAALIFQRRSTAERAAHAAVPGSVTRAPSAAGATTPAADSHLEIVARLTQRFCPQCRSPLSADAPEGLCPACLMAGAMGSDPDGAAFPVHGDAVTTPPTGSRPPLTGEIGDLQQHFPQLEIRELLGRGGMGAVYKARQKNLDRFVAIKVIPPEAASDPAFAERFAREARAMARLNHPNIVTVYDYGEAGGTFWLLMEYIDGVNLRQTLRAGRLSPSEALAIVPPVCDALQYAHDQGVVHRDIKPENVLLDRTGRVKIADFGLAKLLGKGPDDFTLTRTQQVMGTPRYMAPEQIEKPISVDHRADIYSLGVMIYEMLTGELPLGRFALPSERAGVDARIDQVVLRALEKEPDRRYQRASQVKTELASASQGIAAASRVAAAAAQTVVAAAPSGLYAADWHPPQETPQSRPTWHTPAYATKTDTPGGVPLGQVLVVAFGMVLGVLLMGGGLAAIIYGTIYSFGSHATPGFLGACFGGGFGCFVGGFGAAAGSYNTYRQMAGAEDLLQSPRTTWFDWTMRGYLLLGLILVVAGLAFWPEPRLAEYGNLLMLLGSIASFQAALFLIWRGVSGWHGGGREAPIKPRSAPPIDPRLQRIRRRVAGPAVGLMIAGIIALLPFVAAVFAVPAVTVVPQQVELRAPAPPIGSVSGATLMLKRLIAPALGMGNILLPILAAEAAIVQASGARWATLMLGLMALLNFPLAITMIVGGWQMRRLKSYALALVASIIALLPCTFGWLLGLPMGLWALTTLLDEEVRKAFDRDQIDTGPAGGMAPAAAPDAAASSSASGSQWGARAIAAVAGVLLLLCGVLLVVVLGPGWRSARAAANRAHSTNNLRQIGIALHNYHEVHRSFPPAVVKDAGGTPLYSGRVLLLPFLGYDDVYTQFDLTLPWNDPRNRPHSETALKIFLDPAGTGGRARTDYLFITGPGTILGAGKNVSIVDVLDGTSTTLLLVEVKGNNSSWAAPRELEINGLASLPTGHHGDGNLLLFADGSVDFIQNEMLSPSKLRSLATYQGAEPLELDPEDFRKLVDSFRRETFDSGKLSFIKAASRTSNFSCRQARELLQQFTFDEEREEAAVVLYPRLTDRENFFEVLESFTFDTGRQTVRKRLNLD